MTNEQKNAEFNNPEAFDERTLANKNLARRSTTVSAGALFVISATAAILCLCALFWFTSVRSGIDSLNTYGYNYLTYEGEEVAYGSYVYETYYFYDLAYENPEEYSKYEVERTYFDIEFNDELFKKNMGILWLVEIIALIVAPLSLLFAILRTGPKNSDGSIRLNWFDRVFMELYIVIAVFVTLGLYFSFLMSQAWFFKSETGNILLKNLLNSNSNFLTIKSWLDVSWSDFGISALEYAFEPEWILVVLSAVLTLAIVLIDLVLFLSIVRRIKARSFWRTTILGSIISAIRDSIASSSAIKGKVLGALIGGILLMLLGASLAISIFGYDSIIILLIGAAIMIIIVLFTVPRQISKYEIVRTGISELRNGNFSYKVPNLGNGELGRLAESVNSISEAQDIAIQKELQSQRLRTELISNVSHDIRTPLTSMSSYVDLLNQEGLSSPNAEEYMRIISEKTNRLRKLTDDLFEAAKASSGDIPVSIEKLDMYAMVEQALAELDESINKNKIEVILTNHAKNTTVYADGKLLWRVVENILTNVTKYSLTGTRAYMDIFEEDDSVILEVKNMSREQLNISSQELMERFKRGDSSRNTDGSGLGLAIASDLTHLMGGIFDINIDGDLFKAKISLKKAN